MMNQWLADGSIFLVSGMAFALILWVIDRKTRKASRPQEKPFDVGSHTHYLGQRTVVAGERLWTGDMVYVGADGKAYKAIRKAD